jgi:hypothetical protein
MIGEGCLYGCHSLDLNLLERNPFASATEMAVARSFDF